MICKTCDGISMENKKKMCEWLLLIFIAANLVPPAKDLPEDGKYRLLHGEGIRMAFPHELVMY